MTINEMIELRKAATEGPWDVEFCPEACHYEDEIKDGYCVDGPTYHADYENPMLCYADAAYIAACGNFDWEAVRDVVEAASNDILMELDLLISRYRQIAQHPSSNEDDRRGALSAIKEVQNKLDRLSAALARLEGEA
jgi:hypothetical protein